jgi:PAS domain S-box-containing protein
MQSSPLPQTHQEVSAQVERLTLRIFFGTGLFGSLVGAVLLGLLPLTLSWPMRIALPLVCVLLAGTFALAGWLLRKLGVSTASRISGWATLIVVTLISIGLGQGVHATTLGFFAVVICVIGITAGLRTGIAMSVYAIATVVALAAAEYLRWLPGGTTPPMPVELPAVTLILMIVSGLAAGTLISRITATYMSAASERERRFAGLLGIAADWYWEMDDQFRFTHLAENTPGASLVSAETRVGSTPWDILNFGIGAAAMDAHRSDLEAHRPFHGLLVRRRDPQGQPRYGRVSGQPRFDARGVFVGYWGVGRDSTAEVMAQMSLVASETRYRELFNRAPSAFVLSRQARIIDANPAGVRLFGYPTLADMLGQSFKRHFVDAESAQRILEREHKLESLRLGEAIDSAPMKLTSLDGRTRYVQGAVVKVSSSEGAAALSIFNDETEQRMADAALRRSQSLLAHLVESSPDSITLTELDSGRHVMVNEAFVRWFGFTADEVIGVTAAQLGIWAFPEERAALNDAIQLRGRVDNYPVTFVDKRQARIQAMVSGAMFEEDGQRYIVIASRDITDAERTRLEHQAILQSAGIGIAFTREQRFLHTNPHFERIFGWPEGSLAGERGSVIWPSMREYEEVGGLAGPLLSSGKPVELERPMRRLDGSVFWCRLLAKVVDPLAPTQGGTIWIAEDVSERRRVEQALAAARDEAEAANRAKSAFLANTSHEIRTPLNGLLGMAQLALDETLDETRRRQYIAQIHDSAKSLAGIISDILDLSKIEAGKFTLESQPFGLRDTLEAVHRAYQTLAEEKGLTLSLEIEEGLPATVLGDGVRVRQIITNYVTNALKFTTRGGVRIHARRLQSGWVRVAVSDSGPGIDAPTVQRLFTPFTQADGSTTRRYGGTGLGLSICRQLAQLMGGDVGVSSNPGHGSTFWAELPLAEAAAAEVPMLDPPDPAERLRGAKVLVAEDNPVNMMIAAAMLEQWGIEVAQATDGRAAVDAALAADRDGVPFDAVLMDVQMPHMSGHEAARTLRRSFDGRRLPIIALTAAALVSERDQAMSAGMNDFLTKPIDSKRLRDTLAHYIGQRRQNGPLHRTG